ncbi:hypothetical protein BGX38DRAFT_1128043 [Terfezia claveryi]|nr:hypothetical protein BGX38DRAFT_1128043 [Terfezia claveryi]
MPVPVMAEIFYSGLHSVPWAASALTIAPYAAALYILRWYFSGARNSHERIMNSKVVMVTGGTSGIGESLVYSLATRGAQIILLVKDISDPFLIDRINFLREHTNNQLIYAEQCDLSSLHSVRLFATKWIDNAPPRRLDLILLCASHSPPPFSPQQFTHDGADKVWGINYLANFHLLTLLAPAIRNQPPDRDVRVIAATCGSYMLSPPLAQHIPDPAFISRCGFPSKPWQATGAAKLALMSFLLAFNAQNRTYIRKDKELVNARTFIVDPGFARTPSTRSFLTLGSLWGLMVYFLTYPLWWLVLKSPEQAGESFLYAAMSPEGAEGEGGVFYRECRRVEVRRDEVYDAELAKTLWEATEKEIVELEKKGAVERKRRKMEEEMEAKNGKNNTQDGDKGKGKGVAVGVGIAGTGKRIEEIIEEVEAAKSGTTASGSENLKKKEAARSRKG